MFNFFKNKIQQDTELDNLFEIVWQKMREYYGDTGLHNKLKQLQEQEK